MEKRASWPLHRDTHCTMKPEGLGCLGRQEGGEKGGEALSFLSWACDGVRWAVGGWKEMRRGLRQAGWPGPLLADGGKRHLGLSLGMLSSAAIVWWVEQQTHALRVSQATRNRNRPPPPPYTHPPPSTEHIHASPTCFSEPHCISGLHILHTTGAVARRSAAFSHTPDLGGLRRARGQTSGDTPAVSFHRDTENQKQRNGVYNRVRISDSKPGSRDKTKQCHISVNALIRHWPKVSVHAHLWFCWTWNTRRKKVQHNVWQWADPNRLVNIRTLCSFSKYVHLNSFPS